MPTQSTPAEEPRKVPTKAERKGKRGHDDHGNVRPADGRYGLHDPEDESEVVRSPVETPDQGAPDAGRPGRATTRKDRR